MTSRRSAILRCGAVALATWLPDPPPLARHSAAAPLPHDADKEFERLLRLANVPSLTYALIDGDHIVTQAIGVKRTGETERVTADTVYSAASLTKAVFAYMVLGLVQEGVLSLDRPVREYLPLPTPSDPHAGAITARHLLSHSSGWPNWRNDAAEPLASEFEPGTQWRYSGEGYFFLQRVVEKLTGKGVGLLARQRVFEPLGMTRSSMVGLAEFEPLEAPGHDWRGEPATVYGRAALLELRRRMAARGLPLDAARVEDSERALAAAEPKAPLLPNYLSPNAAASLLTTANDYGRFLRHVVTARRHGGTPAAIVDLMTSPQVRCNEVVQWGLGAGLEDLGSRRFAWQWGDNSGFKNFYVANPRDEKAMVIFTNGDHGARVYERVVRTKTGDDHAGFLMS